MADLASDSFNSSLAVSDSDLETINNEELVIFDSTQTFYSNTEDIIAQYSWGNAFESTPRDWVGLFKKGWQTVYDFSAYQWAPLEPLNVWQPHRRRAIFPKGDIQDLCGNFQFLYVTGDYHVIGVSDFLRIADPSAAETTFCGLGSNVDLTASMSLISLDSLSSLSDEPETVEPANAELDGCVDKPSEISAKVNAVAEEIPKKDERACPTSSPQRDSWSLSDFDIGYKEGGVRQTLSIVPFKNCKELVEEYEPLKQFYGSLRQSGRTLVEEIPNRICAFAVKCPDVSACATAMGQASVVAMTGSPFSFSFPYDGFIHSFLQIYRQRLLESSLFGPFALLTPLASSYPKLNTFPLVLRQESQGTCPSDNDKNESYVQSFTDMHLVHRDCQPMLSVKTRKSEDDKTGHVSSKTGCSMAPSDISHKKATTNKSSRDLRKKRFIRRSKIKQNRNKHDTMLQDALALLGKPSSPTESKSMGTLEQTRGSVECSDKSESTHSVVPSRKRQKRASTDTSTFKRRCLSSKAPAAGALPPGSHGTEDEGYCSLDEEGRDRESNCRTETLQVLSLALTEALKNNAQLRLQLQHASRDGAMEKEAEEPLGSAVKTETAGKASANPAIKNKTVNTKNKAKRHAASNTTDTAKKDNESQCKKVKTRRKATNTERQEKRHATCNTPAINKQDTHSQCPVTTTAGKSVNTLPPPSKRDVKSNTPVAAKTHSAAHTLSNSPRAIKPTLSDTVTMDITVRSASCFAPSVSDLQDNLAKWKTVSSRRMVRLRRLIARKKEEFNALRENAENYERRLHMLEASLESSRIALSAETIKRLQTEKELQELRTKYWELLASRSSQPWNTNKANCYERKLLPVKPLLLPDLDPRRSTDSLPTMIVSEMPAKDQRDVKKTKNKKELPNMKTDTSASTENSFLSLSKSSQSLETPTKEDNTRETLSKERRTLTTAAKVKKVLETHVKAGNTLETPTKENNILEIHAKEENAIETPAKEEKTLEIPAKEEKVRKQNLAFEEAAKPINVQSLMNPFQFHSTPAKVSEGKKPSCTSISIKKLLMPAMTAIAETFGSTKSKPKPTACEDNGSTFTTQHSSCGTITSVTVSVSAGVGSKKSSSRAQKTAGKSRRTKSSSSNRSKERKRAASSSKGSSCQESNTDSSSSVDLHPGPPLASAFKCRGSEQVKTFIFPQNKTVPKAKQAGTERKMTEAITVGSVDESNATKQMSAENGDTMEWSPLIIPAEGCAKNDDIICCDPVGKEQPVKFRFTKPKSGGQSRAGSHCNVSSGKFTRNHFARAIMDRNEGENGDDTIKVTSPALPDIIKTSSAVDTALTRPFPALPFPLLLKPSFSIPFIPTITSPPVTTQRRSAMTLVKDLAVHGYARQRQRRCEDLEERRQQQHQQSPTPTPRALHCDYMRTCTDSIGRQLRQGMCLTCGMKFSPSVDRHLVEEHIYFHHAFTE